MKAYAWWCLTLLPLASTVRGGFDGLEEVPVDPSGDATLRDAAIQTIDGIRDIKRELPGVYTVLGLSNISFGLLPQSRKILNSVFLHDAVEAGLDAAIVDASKILPLAMISEEDRTIAADLLYDRVEDGAAENDTPLMRFSTFWPEPRRWFWLWPRCTATVWRRRPQRFSSPWPTPRWR